MSYWKYRAVMTRVGKTAVKGRYKHVTQLCLWTSMAN